MINFAPGLMQRIRLSLRHRKRSKLLYLRRRESPISRQDMLGYPCVPQLTPEELQVLNWVRRELGDEIGSEEILDDCDLLRFALQELQLKLQNSQREDVILRLTFYLWNTRQNTTDRSA